MTEIKNQIAKWRDYLELIQAIPAVNVFPFTQNEWVQAHQQSEGRFVQKTYETCDIEIITRINRELRELPAGVEHLIALSNETPFVGRFFLSKYKELIFNKLQNLLDQEGFFSGEFRACFYHEHDICAELWEQICGNAGEFQVFHTQVYEEVNRKKLTAFRNGGTWRAYFSKLNGEGQYEECQTLSKFRIKI